MGGSPVLDDSADAGLIGGIKPVTDGGTVIMGSLTWRVIGKSDSAWLVLCDGSMYNSGTYWLAEQSGSLVYDSFSEPEKAAVIPTNKGGGQVHVPRRGSCDLSAAE